MHRSTQPRRPGLAVVAAGFLVAAGVVAGPATPTAGAQQCTIVLQADSYATTPGVALVVPDHGVVSNDTICGSDGLVISTSSPSHGTLTDFDDSGGGFTYTPDQGFTGTDSFTYTLEDVQGIPSVTVTITVSAPTTTSTTETTTPTTVPVTTVTSAPTPSTSTTVPVEPAAPAAPAVSAATFTG